jgi:hypothetical protein
MASTLSAFPMSMQLNWSSVRQPGNSNGVTMRGKSTTGLERVGTSSVVFL